MSKDTDKLIEDCLAEDPVTSVFLDGTEVSNVVYVNELSTFDSPTRVTIEILGTSITTVEENGDRRISISTVKHG